MHVQTISLAALATWITRINVADGKNWILIDCENNGQTDKASDYLYMHMKNILLAMLASWIF